jgi:hypothetical protein
LYCLRFDAAVVQKGALTRLLVEGIITQGEFLEMVRVVEREMKG